MWRADRREQDPGHGLLLARLPAELPIPRHPDLPALRLYLPIAEQGSTLLLALLRREVAIRRAGELINQIEPAHNHHGNSTKDAGVPSSRKQAARDAGMSVCANNGAEIQTTVFKSSLR
ncbi:hypothetical protein [Aliiruegeria lutimaris]|uniref:hypothetical protein n=1 Tax=Aliiruegeria lutimaris TaxID=571298 RepID=UPI000B83AAD6|nr:hypothetical protein [Aliiruegeria lutimaris]